jgi:hypothetical protein
MASNLIILPLAFQFLAIIFSPIGLAVSTQCSVNPFNNPACGVQFSTTASVAFTTNGYSYQIAQDAQNCSDVNIAGVSIGQVFGNPFNNGVNIENIPGLSNILNFFVGLGQTVRADLFATQQGQFILQNTTNGLVIANNNQLVNGGLVFYSVTSPQGAAYLAQYNQLEQQKVQTNNVANACYKGATALLIVSTNISNDAIALFIGVVFTAAAISAVTAIAIGASGMNAGGTLIIFTTSSLGLIYLILSAIAFPTWATIPQPFGSTLYVLMTLAFALGVVDQIGAVAV